MSNEEKMEQSLSPVESTMNPTTLSVPTTLMEIETRPDFMIQLHNLVKTKRIGDGSYGVVYTAHLSTKPGHQLAVKRNIIEDNTDFIGSLRELDLLLRLQGHPNIVSLVNVGYGTSFKSGVMSPLQEPDGLRDDQLHFVFEHASYDFHSYIYRVTTNVLQSMESIKSAMAQLLLGLEYIHGHGLVHRDVKPGNILVFKTPEDGLLFKFCDFGLAKMFTKNGPQSPKLMTSWYRAPEACVKEPIYDYKSDIWSLGLVFAEIFTKRALLYECGDKNKQIMYRISTSIPMPKEDHEYFLELANRKKKICKTCIKASPELWARLLKFYKKQVPAGLVDMIQAMLRVNPQNRPTTTQLLKSDFFACQDKEIQEFRHLYPPVVELTSQISVVDCSERQWGLTLIKSIPNLPKRTLFQALDLYDRCLLYLSSTLQERSHTSENCGKYINKNDAELWAYVCTYASIKYFSTRNAPCSFKDLLENKKYTPFTIRKMMAKASEYEKTLVIDVLCGQIYRPTLYEAANEPTEQQIKDLLVLYDQLGRYNGFTVHDLYQLYSETGK